MVIQKSFITLTEYCSPHIIEIPLNQEEIDVLQSDALKQKIKVFMNLAGNQMIETQQYVGYIILEHHIISITPKIPRITLLNMVKYTLNLPELMPGHFELSEENNYYDFLVLFLLLEIEDLLERGLITGYKNFEDNLNRLRGKILFEENIINNYDRNDKLLCSFSEISQDIQENQIIKYTLFYLSRCSFLDEDINSEILRYYNRFNHISLKPISSTIFKSLEYTPLNQHYKPVLILCELFLRDSSIDDENLGAATVNSFLIDMNILFERFVVNLIKERLINYEVEEQKTIFADIDEKLKLKYDILLSQNGEPILILDTKYKKFEENPEPSDVSQLISYCNSIHVKNCGLIYPEKLSNILYRLHQDIKLHIISLDLAANDRSEFEAKCTDFLDNTLVILHCK